MQSPWNHCVNVSFCSGKVTGATVKRKISLLPFALISTG